MDPKIQFVHVVDDEAAAGGDPSATGVVGATGPLQRYLIISVLFSSNVADRNQGTSETLPFLYKV